MTGQAMRLGLDLNTKHFQLLLSFPTISFQFSLLLVIPLLSGRVLHRMHVSSHIGQYSTDQIRKNVYVTINPGLVSCPGSLLVHLGRMAAIDYNSPIIPFHQWCQSVDPPARYIRLCMTEI